MEPIAALRPFARDLDPPAPVAPAGRPPERDRESPSRRRKPRRPPAPPDALETSEHVDTTA